MMSKAPHILPMAELTGIEFFMATTHFQGLSDYISPGISWTGFQGRHSSIYIAANRDYQIKVATNPVRCKGIISDIRVSTISCPLSKSTIPGYLNYELFCWSQKRTTAGRRPVEKHPNPMKTSDSIRDCLIVLLCLCLSLNVPAQTTVTWYG